MKRILIFLIAILYLTGCGRSEEVTITGHITLANTPVNWEEFTPPQTESSSNSLKIKSLLKEDEEDIDKLLLKFKDNYIDKLEEVGQRYDLSLVDSIDKLGVKVFKNNGRFKIEDILKELNKKEYIDYVELNSSLSIASVAPTDSQYYERQWNYPLISLPQAWEISKGSLEVVVAVLDTGLSLEHREFEGRLLAGKNFTVDEGDERRDNPDDYSGHGSHVAGIIGALANNDGGEIAGMNWNVSILPVKVLSGGLLETGNNLTVSQGIIWATDEGAQIINLSLGGPRPSRVMEEAIKYAYERGVTIIAAAGNYRYNNRPMELLYPAAYPQVIAVGSVDYDLGLSEFSYVGHQIDFVAPGRDIYSTYRYNRYETLDGTSMATPHVAGLAALLLAEGVVTTPQGVKERLRLTAHSLGNVGWDYRYGYGLINAHAALADAKITDAVLFLGRDEGDKIKVLSQIEGVDHKGLYSIDPIGEEARLFAWIDTNGNGKVDKGDYFAYTSNEVTSTVKVDLTLTLIEDELEYQVMKNR